METNLEPEKYPELSHAHMSNRQFCINRFEEFKDELNIACIQMCINPSISEYPSNLHVTTREKLLGENVKYINDILVNKYGQLASKSLTMDMIEKNFSHLIAPLNVSLHAFRRVATPNDETLDIEITNEINNLRNSLIIKLSTYVERVMKPSKSHNKGDMIRIFNSLDHSYSPSFILLPPDGYCVRGLIGVSVYADMIFYQ